MYRVMYIDKKYRFGILKDPSPIIRSELDVKIGAGCEHADTPLNDDALCRYLVFGSINTSREDEGWGELAYWSADLFRRAQ